MNETGRPHPTPLTRLLTAALLAGASLFALTACNGGGPVSYAGEVAPILQANCLSCHQEGGAGFQTSGFSMVSYEDLMKGTQYGPMILAGDSEGSNLVVLMEGRADPSINMPHGGMQPVSAADIATIRRWIDQGARNN